MPVARLVLVVVCTLVPAALETTVGHAAMPLVHSIVGSVGHTIVGCTAPHCSVVVGPCFVRLTLLPRHTLIY